MRDGVAWLVLGVIIGGSVYPIMVEAQDYFGKFPPTPAFQDFQTDSNATINPLLSQNFINATSYNDRMFIISDGSLNIFITEYP